MPTYLPQEVWLTLRCELKVQEQHRADAGWAGHASHASKLTSEPTESLCHLYSIQKQTFIQQTTDTICSTAAGLNGKDCSVAPSHKGSRDVASNSNSNAFTNHRGHRKFENIQNDLGKACYTQKISILLFMTKRQNSEYIIFNSKCNWLFITVTYLKKNQSNQWHV